MVLYVEPWEHHSLATISDQPMGFLCVIPNKDMLKKIENLIRGGQIIEQSSHEIFIFGKLNFIM